MNPSKSTDQGYTFTIDDTGICLIEPQGKLTISVAAEIAQNAMTHIVQFGLPVGLLIDVRQNTLLSIVRLSNLLDTLTGLGVPVAVVFLDDQQKHLASMLHNTLAQKDSVVYFTDSDHAVAHLQHDPQSHAPAP